ncbi:hypothetical protein [Butyrivibrio sp. MC2021]|uniref:hypothetical protein n=1 Tax=Butyrivibrio sp. MC2021 TaxID=1408306 RepID=UPI000478AC24|nr:hypothetical protein [Butyrivibrio sp. MC2021]
MKKFCCKSKKIVAKRGLALAVAASVALANADMTSMAVADEAEIDPIEIALFEDLDKDVAYQQLNPGASEADIVFPDTLRAIKSNVDNIILEDDGEADYTDDTQEQNGEDSSDNGATVIELPFDDDIEEEEPEEEITVEEDNIVARLIGSFFDNVFNGFSTTAFAADSDEINIAGVEWTLSEELSDRPEFTSDEEWLRFVYVPEIPSVFVTDAELPNITVDVIGGEVLGEVRTGDMEEEAEFEEEETKPVLPDNTKPYSYVSKGGTATLLTEVLSETKDEAGTADAPILTADLIEKVIIDGAPVSNDTELFEAKQLKVDSDNKPSTDESGNYVEDTTETGKWFLITKKGFVDENKTLTVKLKLSGTSDSSSEAGSGSSTEDTSKEYVIKITADATDSSVKVINPFIYNTVEQELKASDIEVKIGDTKLTAETDYVLVPIKKTNAGTYDFTVTFVGETYGTLGKATGEWEIKPVNVMLAANNLASIKDGEPLAFSSAYTLTCLDESVKDKFTTNEIEGVTVTVAPTSSFDNSKVGEYPLTLTYTGSNDNYNITVSAETATYFIIDIHLKIVNSSTSKEFTDNQVPYGTKYTAKLYASDTSKLEVKNLAIYYVSAADSTASKTAPTALGSYSAYGTGHVNWVINKAGTKVTINNPSDPTTARVRYDIVDAGQQITSSDVKLSKTSFTYNSKEQGPTVTVTVDGQKLSTSYYDISGDTKETDADDYEITITGKNGYTGTVTKSWKINPLSISSATIPSSTKVSYSYTGNEIEHSAPKTITVSGLTLTLDEEYEVDESKSTLKATKAGTYTVYLKAYDDNFTGTKSYTWKITSSSSSSTGKASSSVNFSNPNNVSTGVTNVASSGLSTYASSKKVSGKTVTYTLNVKPISKSTLGSTELNTIAEYGDESVVNTDSLDVTVHKTVKNNETENTESDEDVSDLGSAIDVIAYIGTTNAAKTVNVIREHSGEVKKFSKLSSRPSSSFTDGTYYVDKSNGKVYIYSRYFSRFTLIYTETDAVVKTSTKSSSSSSSSSSGDALGARAPQTGDNLPVVWVWVIVLLAGVGLIGFSAFELKRFKRGDFKKKR